MNKNYVALVTAKAFHYFLIGILGYIALSFLLNPDLIIESTKPIMGTFYGQF
jgi:hypothetical protein